MTDQCGPQPLAASTKHFEAVPYIDGTCKQNIRHIHHNPQQAPPHKDIL